MYVAIVLLAAGCLAKESTEKDSFSVNEAFDRITIDSDAGDVVLVGSDSDKANFDLVLKYERAQPELLWGVEEDGTLLIEVRCTYPGTLCRIDFEGSIPNDKVVLVDTRDGAVRVEGVEEIVTVDVGKGSAEVVDCGSDVTIDLAAGEAVAEGIRGIRTVATTGDGAVSVGHIGAIPELVQAATSSGDVVVVVPAGTYNLDTSYASGGTQIDPEVYDDPTADPTIRAETGKGSITIDSAG